MPLFSFRRQGNPELEEHRRNELRMRQARQKDEAYERLKRQVEEAERKAKMNTVLQRSQATLDRRIVQHEAEVARSLARAGMPPAKERHSDSLPRVQGAPLAEEIQHPWIKQLRQARLQPAPIELVWAEPTYILNPTQAQETEKMTPIQSPKKPHAYRYEITHITTLQTIDPIVLLAETIDVYRQQTGSVPEQIWINWFHKVMFELKYGEPLYSGKIALLSETDLRKSGILRENEELPMYQATALGN